MSKGDGGTGGMEAAAAESNALQKQIYEEGIARGEPWYDAGKQGLGTLLDYMGLQGGSQQSRSQISNELSPQFQTTTTSGTGGDAGGLYRNIRTGEGEVKYFDQAPTRPSVGSNRDNPWQAVNPQTTTTSTDQVGLDAAIQAQLDSQLANKPDTFGSLLTPFGQEQFQEDAGYQFRVDEGNKALERQLAAQGKTFSPEAAKELTRFNQGLGAQEYGNAYSRYNADQGNIYNRLAGIAGMGQQEIAQANALGTNFAGQVGQTNASLANAQAAASQGGGSMFGDLLGLGGLAVQAAPLFSDRDLKENIEYVGKEKGHNLYTFNYKGDNRRFKGVMAQEVVETRPDAVCMLDGYFAVDYDRLGLMMEVA